MDMRVNGELTVPENELQVRFTPSGGPGGQHANRSNTRVELTWDVEASAAVSQSVRTRVVDKLGPVVRIVVDDERSQMRNREIAYERLRVRLQAALHRPKARRKTKPSRSSQRRRVAGKRQRGQLKQQRRKPGRED